MIKMSYGLLKSTIAKLKDHVPNIWANTASYWASSICSLMTTGNGGEERCEVTIAENLSSARGNNVTIVSGKGRWAAASEGWQE